MISLGAAAIFQVLPDSCTISVSGNIPIVATFLRSYAGKRHLMRICRIFAGSTKTVTIKPFVSALYYANDCGLARTVYPGGCAFSVHARHCIATEQAPPLFLTVSKLCCCG